MLMVAHHDCSQVKSGDVLNNVNIIHCFQDTLSDLGQTLRDRCKEKSRGIVVSETELSEIEERILEINNEIYAAMTRLAAIGEIDNISVVCFSRIAEADIQIQSTERPGKITKTVRFVDEELDNPNEGMLSLKFMLGKCLCGARAGDGFRLGTIKQNGGMRIVQVLDVRPIRLAA